MQKSGRFKEVEGYPFHYACDLGYVFRIKCVIRDKQFPFKVWIKSRYHDYRSASLNNGSGRKTMSVQFIIALAFIQNPFRFKEINHKDRVRDNNHVSNLEWCTHSHNIRHISIFDKENKKGRYADDWCC